MVAKGKGSSHRHWTADVIKSFTIDWNSTERSAAAKPDFTIHEARACNSRLLRKSGPIDNVVVREWRIRCRTKLGLRSIACTRSTHTRDSQLRGGNQHFHFLMDGLLAQTADTILNNFSRIDSICPSTGHDCI